jgi:hypothetical protein
MKKGGAHRYEAGFLESKYLSPTVFASLHVLWIHSYHFAYLMGRPD